MEDSERQPPSEISFLLGDIELLADVLPSLLEGCFDEAKGKWLLTILMGNAGHKFAERGNDLPPDDICRIAARLEVLLTCKDEYVETAVATGFLEAMVHYFDDHPEVAWVRDELGQEAREYLTAYDNLWGIKNKYTQGT